MSPTFHPDVFRGKRALVTGGLTGIGSGIARAFLAAGASVTATSVTDADVAAACTDAALAGAECRVLDVRDDAAVRALVGGLDRLDVLVNCAGIIRRLDEHGPEVFAEVVDVNLTGTMRLCAAARPLLAKSGGAIVNTASMFSFFGSPISPAYTASKGGVAQLTKALAVAYAPQGIRVNAIAPGWIDTPLTAPLQQDTARYGAIRDRIALKRWGKPDDVAGAVLFLCSPAAAYITGVILPVDGGYLAV